MPDDLPPIPPKFQGPPLPPAFALAPAVIALAQARELMTLEAQVRPGTPQVATLKQAQRATAEALEAAAYNVLRIDTRPRRG